MSVIVSILFGLLLLAFCMAIAGVIRPSWINVKTRKEAAQAGAGCLIVLLILTPFLPNGDDELKDWQEEQKGDQQATKENLFEKMKREALADFGTATPEERRQRKVMENYWDALGSAVFSCVKQQEAAYLAQHPHAEKLPNAMGQQVLNHCLDEVEQQVTQSTK